MTKADRLASALDDFLAVSPEVEAAAVVSADGLPIASALPPHVEEDRLAAMSAALLTLGERAAEGLGKGELAQVFVEGDVGHVILMAAGRSAVLVAVSSKEAKVGLVLFEMRKTANRVSAIMEQDFPDVVADPPVTVSQAPSAYAPAPEPEPSVSPVSSSTFTPGSGNGGLLGSVSVGGGSDAPSFGGLPPMASQPAAPEPAPAEAPVSELEEEPAAPEAAAPPAAPTPTPPTETESSVSSWT